MVTRQILTQIGIADLEQAFTLSDENLNTDLSVIRFSMIRDVHYDNIELYVTVFGQESAEEEAPVGEFWMDPDVVSSKEDLDNEIGFKPSRLRILFSVEVLSLIVELNVVMEWLCEDNDLMPLNLLPGKDNGVRLLPVDQ